MHKSTYDTFARLANAGVNASDARAIRRISMTLSRWHELECGTGDSATWYIERGDEGEGRPHLMRSDHAGLHDLGVVPDRERGALKRLNTIMARYPALTAYVQGDPRGEALYILRPGDVPAGALAEAHYAHGIAVCR